MTAETPIIQRRTMPHHVKENRSLILSLRKPSIELFLVSFIMLFIELAIIRWIGTEIRIFAYINNLVLLACFIGIGLGCYLADKKTHISITVLALSVLILCLNLPWILKIEEQYFHFFRDVPQLLSAFTDSVIWQEAKVNSVFFMIILGMISIFIIFFLILFVFFPIGQILGRLLNEHDNPITAYSINIAASVLGIWCFSLYSFLYTPPYKWFGLIVALLLILLLIRSEYSLQNLLSIILLILLVIITMLIPQKRQSREFTIWSPYQKLMVRPFLLRNIQQGFEIFVNNTGYMVPIDLSDDFMRKHPGYLSQEVKRFNHYNIPYLFKKDAKDVLILGAGAGNDAAGALRNGVETVEAVEIDPIIYDMGLQLHPEKPYSDPRVSIIIDDARSYLKKSTKTYDVISFGFLDSHTLSSSYNNMRLDHYVYTKESFQEAKALLKKDGVLVVNFSSQRPWISRRIYGLLEEVFGHPPRAFFAWSGFAYSVKGSMFIISENMKVINRAIEEDGALKRFINGNRIDFSRKGFDTPPFRLTTDDWPYLYLERPLIPKMHLSVMGILFILFLIGKKAMFSKGQRLNLHFFFLGAAFLLLEFQNISKSTLLFGSTWLVNTFTISAIMGLILMANYFVRTVNFKNVKSVYLLLVLSILILYFLPLRTFNALGTIQKGIIGSVILNIPIFFAGIIFIYSFNKTLHKNLAFGSNLIGAALGGTLESLSFVFGIKTLLLVVLGFYCLSFAYLKRE